MNRDTRDGRLRTISTVALVNLEQETDRNLATSFQYIMTRERLSFPIENFQGDVTRLISIMDTYYSRGVRIFIGLASSNTVAAVLPWFENHQDAIGVSTGSSASSLAFPKPVIRLTPSDSLFVILSESLIRRSASRLILITDEEELFARDFRNRYLERLRDIAIPLSSTDSDIITKLSSLVSTDMVIPLVRDQDRIQEMFEQANLQSQILGIVGVRPIFTPSQEQLYSNRWIHGEIVNPLMTRAAREMIGTLGVQAIVSTYDAVNIAYRFNTDWRDQRSIGMNNIYQLVNQTLGYEGVLDLNTNNDRQYADFVLYDYDPSRQLQAQGNTSDDKWRPRYILSFTPNIGLSESEIVLSDMMNQGDDDARS